MAKRRNTTTTTDTAIILPTAPATYLPAPVATGTLVLSNFKNVVTRLNAAYFVDSSFNSISKVWNYGFYYRLQQNLSLQQIADLGLAGAGICVANGNGSYDFYYGGFGMPEGQVSWDATLSRYVTTKDAPGYIRGTVLSTVSLTSITYIIGSASTEEGTKYTSPITITI